MLRSLVLSATLLLGAVPAGAATLNGFGQSILGARYHIGDFTILFDDTNGDSLLQLSEITSFSGIQIVDTDPGGFGTRIYETVLQTPNVTGISTFERNHSNAVFNGSWYFRDLESSNQFAVLGTDMTYDLDLTAVPLPAGLPLLAAACAALGLLRRRRTAATA